MILIQGIWHYQEWFQNGWRHRNGDKPASIWHEGSKFWYQNGLLHRVNKKPSIIYSNGSKFWHQNGICTKKKLK